MIHKGLRVLQTFVRHIPVSLILRTIAVFILFALILLVPFLLWNDSIEELLGGQLSLDLIQSYGHLGWMIAIALLCADLVLPIPASAIMSNLGTFYGWLLGGLFSTLGLFVAGLIGYSLCYLLGDKVALWLCGEKDLQRARRFFDQWGGIAVAGSRFLPILPEAITCLAGMTRMRLKRFLFALFCGSLPTGYAYATLGHLGSDDPVSTTLIAAAIPLLLWLPIYVFWMRKNDQDSTREKAEEQQYEQMRRDRDDSSSNALSRTSHGTSRKNQLRPISQTRSK